VNLGALSQALDEPLVPVGRGASRAPAAAQATIRAELDRLVQSTGMVKQMAGAESKTITAGSTSFMGPGVRGWHSSATDEIAVHAPRYKEAARFAAKAAKGRAGRASPDEISSFRTLVHETIHAHSPMVHTVYRGAGKVVEEVTVESSARKLMRDEFAVTGHVVGFPLGAVPDLTRSYDPWILEMRQILEVSTGMTGLEAQGAIEDAALAMRRHKGAPVAKVRDYVDHFVKKLPIPSRLLPGVQSAAVERRRLRNQVASGIVSKWKVF
jgi:hypothetical protein